MGTFHACGIGGQLVEGIGSPMVDLPPAQDFAPTEIDTDTWLAALKSFGAKRAVLVVSHGCGFNTFPSKTAFPEFGFEYNYTIARSPWMGGKGDIAAMFIASCKKYGINPGFYHGAMNNAFLNVHGGTVRPGISGPGGADITQDQYTKILLANLRQLCMDLRHASPPGPNRLAFTGLHAVMLMSAPWSRPKKGKERKGSPQAPIVNLAHAPRRLIRVWFSAAALAPCPHLAMHDSSLAPSLHRRDRLRAAHRGVVRRRLPARDRRLDRRAAAGLQPTPRFVHSQFTEGVNSN